MRYYVLFQEGNFLLLGGGADSATSSVTAFSVQIFPRFSTQRFPRLIHMVKKKFMQKVHFSTNLRQQKHDEISGNLLLMGGGRNPPPMSAVLRVSCFSPGWLMVDSAPLPSGISCISIFHYKNLIFGKNNYTMKNYRKNNEFTYILIQVVGAVFKVISD